MCLLARECICSKRLPSPMEPCQEPVALYHYLRETRNILIEVVWLYGSASAASEARFHEKPIPQQVDIQQTVFIMQAFERDSQKLDNYR